MTKRDADDETLADMAGRGDEDASAELFERHRRDLESRVRRRMPAALNRRAAASDIVQECFAAAFTRMATFEDRGAGSFGRWLRTILEYKLRDAVRNHMVRSRRTVRREISQATGHAGRAVARDPRTAGGHAAASEQQQQVAAALMSLPPDYRSMLRLVHEGRMAVQEAGEQMGRSPEAARKLYGRAVASLAKLVRRGPSPGGGSPDTVPGIFLRPL